MAAVAIASSAGDPASPVAVGSKDAKVKADKPPPSAPSTITTTATTVTSTSTASTQATTTQAEAGDGVALNDQGYSMIGEGDYEGAIPVLQSAVDALRKSGDEQTYNYALFNLAHALRLAGQPEQAIPLLEQRLQYPDQSETVRPSSTRPPGSWRGQRLAERQARPHPARDR